MSGFYRTSAGFVTHLYNEREVERAAWTKYGGPQGYEAQYVSPVLGCVLSQYDLRLAQP
jgi:hypothetical protein